MGNAEDDTPTKTPKSSSTQEQNQTPKSSTAQEQHPPSSPATIFPDWTSYQAAYYNSVGTPPIPPPGFFHSPVASSPQAHAYMWGQHMLPPYGTPPPPYVAMYPHGGLYSHPSMPPGSHPYCPYAMVSPNGTAEPSATMAGLKELEGKSGEGKSKLPLKRSEGSLGSLSMLTGKVNEMEKASGASENGDGFSHSDESHGESSSEGTDAKSHGSQQSRKDSAGARIQNGDAGSNLPCGANQVAVNQSVVMAVPPGSVPCPTTNLNIGMDYRGGSGPSQVPTSRSKLPTKSAAGVIVPSSVIGSLDGVPSELWIPDERELKRQRRKQSNRESARRSRLRKQAEYDELAQRVEILKEENNALQEELKCIREDYEKLASENASLTDKLQIYLGEDLRADGIHEQTGADTQVEANI